MSVKFYDDNEFQDIAGGSPASAKAVPYDNTESGMEATNAQDAIDEIKFDLTHIMKKRSFSGSVTVPANGTARIDISDVTVPDGYQLMGVIGFNSSSSHVYFVNSGVYTAATSTYSINVATDYSNSVNSTIGITLLFIADDIIL